MRWPRLSEVLTGAAVLAVIQAIVLLGIWIGWRWAGHQSAWSLLVEGLAGFLPAFVCLLILLCLFTRGWDNEPDWG